MSLNIRANEGFFGKLSSVFTREGFQTLATRKLLLIVACGMMGNNLNVERASKFAGFIYIYYYFGVNQGFTFQFYCIILEKGSHLSFPINEKKRNDDNLCSAFHVQHYLEKASPVASWSSAFPHGHYHPSPFDFIFQCRSSKFIFKLFFQNHNRFQKSMCSEW